MEWLILVAAIAIGVPAAAWLTQDGLIFFPQPVGLHGAPAGARHAIHGHGRRRHAPSRLDRRGQRAPAPTVIYFGGNAEEVSYTLADPRWPREWSIVALNYRGYGTSEGKPGERELAADALSIYDAVAAREGIDRNRIVAFGRSLGTALAARVAAERPVAGVVLVSPYDSLAAIGSHHYPWLPVSLLLRHRFDAHADARRMQAPMLAIVAGSGLDHPGRALARALRRVGGTEELAGRAGSRPQLARATTAEFLGSAVRPSFSPGDQRHVARR